MTDKIVTVDRRMLDERIGNIYEDEMTIVSEKLKACLSDSTLSTKTPAKEKT